MKSTPCILLLAVLPLLGGCQSAYYGTLEKFGVHKRDVLVDRVEDAKESQEDAKEQFEDALAAFMSVVDVDASELEYAYKRLNGAYSNSERRANDVHDKIARIRSVADALFDEWREELHKYSSDDLRRASERQLDRTRRESDALVASMEATAARMSPVLEAFQDQVLFLKHNLNAQAVASLDRTAGNLQREVGDLIREMEASIAEADTFIRQMRASED